MVSRKRHRAIFISDIHLGDKASQHNILLDFLEHNDADCLYLVGDIIDWWVVRRGDQWTDLHSTVVKKLLAYARVVYLPGNHDHVVLKYFESVGILTIADHIIHVTKDERSFLVTHGDVFDVLTKITHWAQRISEFLIAVFRIAFRYKIYKIRIERSWLNRLFDAITKRRALAEAHRLNVHGVICGHSHQPILETNFPLYVNCGDWVQYCTAVVECSDGKLELVHWKPKQEIIR